MLSSGVTVQFRKMLAGTVKNILNIIRDFFVICIDALLPSVEAANHNALRYCMSTALTSQPALQQQRQTVDGDQNFIGRGWEKGDSCLEQNFINFISQMRQ